MMLLVFAGVLCEVPTACAPQSSRQSTSAVRQVDHILIASIQAKELFSFLSDTCQLPIAWPMTDYGSFASGGIAMGNVNLEIIKDSKSAVATAKSRWTGFALEPEPLRICLAEFDARGIRYGSPAPFRSKQADGSTTTRWTTVGMPEVSKPNVQVFLCEYGDDQSARRRRWLEDLQSRDGGPLSIQSIREVTYGAKDLKQMRERWQKLLDPLPLSPQGNWMAGSGPAIRVVQADEDRIRGIVINVKSLQRARRFLEEHGLLGVEQSEALALSGTLFQGLNVTLVEGP